VITEEVIKIKDGSTLSQLLEDLEAFKDADRKPLDSRTNRAIKSIDQRLQELNALKPRRVTPPLTVTEDAPQSA
jgi:hypothetical protein